MGWSSITGSLTSSVCGRVTLQLVLGLVGNCVFSVKVDLCDRVENVKEMD